MLPLAAVVAAVVVHGTVTFGAGKPAGHVLVEFTQASRIRMATTDVRGRYAVRLEPGAWTALAQRDGRERGEADEEDQLAEGAAVPADHGELDADAGAGVPAHERGERENEAGDPGDPLTRRPEPAGGGPDVAGGRGGAGLGNL